MDSEPARLLSTPAPNAICWPGTTAEARDCPYPGRCIGCPEPEGKMDGRRLRVVLGLALILTGCQQGAPEIEVEPLREEDPPAQVPPVGASSASVVPGGAPQPTVQ